MGLVKDLLSQVWSDNYLAALVKSAYSMSIKAWKVFPKNDNIYTFNGIRSKKPLKIKSKNSRDQSRVIPLFATGWLHLGLWVGKTLLNNCSNVYCPIYPDFISQNENNFSVNICQIYES